MANVHSQSKVETIMKCKCIGIYMEPILGTTYEFTTPRVVYVVCFENRNILIYFYQSL
jgi:hypothetical protein